MINWSYETSFLVKPVKTYRFIWNSNWLVLNSKTQVYKVSSFEQKLMSEIEYRLEQTPPVIELPEDNMYEDVEPGKEVTCAFHH